MARDRAFSRRLPKTFGRRVVYVSPDSQLKFVRPSVEGWDPMLLSWAGDYVSSGDVVWDIGANVGAFTVPAAVKSGTGLVLAVEPDPFLAGLLRRTTEDQGNRDLNIRVLGAAVSDRDGVAELMISSRGRAFNSLSEAGGRYTMGGERGRVLVPTVTLDTLLDSQSPPSILKIDVEGAEGLVLNGATRLLATVRPRVLIEVGQEQAESVTASLLSHGFCLFDASIGIGRSPVTRCVFNTLAIPAEQLPLVGCGEAMP